MNLATLDKLYHLHPGHSLIAPISELEVRGTRVYCSSCAILVYVDTDTYHVAVPGSLTCEHVTGTATSNLPMGQAVHLQAKDTCSNEAIYVGGTHLLHL
jgi:hypothetical protein